MKCNECGTTNSKEALFCNKCGSKLGHFCQDCGSIVEKNDMFCRKCGTPLQKVIEKPVTKLSEGKVAEIPPDTIATSKKKKLKIPVWLSIIMGFIVILCVLVAIFGEINFSIGKPVQTETATAATPTLTTITPTIVPTIAPIIAFTASPTMLPIYEMGEFDFFCSEDQAVQYIHEHQEISFATYIEAMESEMDVSFQDFISKAIFSVMLDGEQIAQLMTYSDQPILDVESGNFRLYWGIDSDPLPVGMHLVESRLSFSEPYQMPESQGGITLGPGTDFESITFQCALLVGAPDESWHVIAKSDFSEAKGLFLDQQTETDYLRIIEKESDDGVFRLQYETLNDDNANFFTIYKQLENLPNSKNLIFSFEADRVYTTEYAEYGLFIRRPEGKDTGYYLSIDPSNQFISFLLAALDSEEVTELFSAQSVSIHQNAKNEITFLANENTFILWINGKLVFYIEDSTIQDSGTFGISVSPMGDGQVEFEIDNLIIRAPGN